MSDADWLTLQGWLDFPADYILVTCSGEAGAGIGPHRDAAYCGSEGVLWNVAGTCTFRYWPHRDAVEHETCETVELAPGSMIRFNAKHLHAAAPSPHRWAVAAWRAKR